MTAAGTDAAAPVTVAYRDRMRPLLCLAALAALFAAGCKKKAETAEPPPPPASSADPARSLSPERKATLDEMVARRIVHRGASGWGPEEFTTLLRVREAQALGAFNLLRRKLATLRGFAVEARGSDGYEVLWLTEPGYRKFVFLWSQEARRYFEERGAQASFVFSLSNLSGKRLFDPSGTLTQEGMEVYVRVKRDLPAFWKYPDGTINGNRRPPREAPWTSAAAPEPAPPPAAPTPRPPPPAGEGEAPDNSAEVPAPASGAGGADAQAAAQIQQLLRSGYVEISDAEAKQLAQKAGRPVESLPEASSLVIVQGETKTFYLLSPSDPLMAEVARLRQES